MKRTYIYCKYCEKVVERYTCEHDNPYLGLNAQRFDPITYHEDATGKVVIPPGNDIPPMPGFIAKTANTFNEVRQLTKRMDSQSRERFEQYHAKRLNIKRENVDRNLEHAYRAREKMSDPLAQRLTDLAIAKMKDQRNESMPAFQPSGHFLALEFDNLKQRR